MASGGLGIGWDFASGLNFAGSMAPFLTAFPNEL
jgi:hypothetical protein